MESNNGSVKKIIYIITGFLAVGLGIIGVIFPVIPAIPLFLLAGFCFGKGSTRFDNWYRGTKFYKKNSERYDTSKGMKKNTKLGIIVGATVVMCILYFLLSAIPIIRGVIVLGWAYLICRFSQSVKTIEI